MRRAQLPAALCRQVEGRVQPSSRLCLGICEFAHGLLLLGISGGGEVNKHMRGIVGNWVGVGSKTEICEFLYRNSPRSTRLGELLSLEIPLVSLTGR